MAQIDCLKKLTNDTSEDIDDCTPSKRLKQARLPFKTIEQKAQIISPKSNSASKKRKLSDAESPSAKAPKTPKSGNNAPEKTPITNNETEVSSSSEAENVKSRVRNTLERFVRKSSQEEITSSTNTECIDLTDSEEGKESELSFVEMNTCQSKNITEFFSVKEKSKTDDIKAKNEIESATILSNATSSENDTQTEKSVENKENVEVPVESNSVDTNTGAVDPVTPGKGSLQSTVMNTPVSSKKSPQSMTTPLSQSLSPGDSLSDGTPNTGKKSRPKLSEAKLKERDALKQKKQEEKQKALEEKKRQKEEERLEKEKEKEKQRLEREAIKAEKERQKKEEKDKKEKERLEKLQQKEEEQRKKREEMEAKTEEKKKREEEKRLKEEEKQKENEDKIKKEQKVKQAFQSFFIKSNTSPNSSKSTKEQSGLFMPFQVKKDTRLAPEYRQKLSDEQKATLDSCLNDQNYSDLYLTELKKSKRPGKSEKTFPKVLADDDVELLVHDSEVVKKVTYKCKLLQFHMNYRPPYYGTWTRKPQNVGPRTPFKTDTDLLDYEYDSDDDWEEEEPGESLSDCEDEDEKDDECKEEEGDDWMVPHGYLSDDEGVEDDEEITPEVLKIRRDAKAEQWESELKRQTKPVLPQIIGCFWEQATRTLQEEISKKLEQYKAVLLVPGPVPTSYSEPVKGDSGDTENSQDTAKVNPQRKPVPEEAMPDLIRLVHGNLMGMKKLIHEFRLYWNSKTIEESVSSNVADVSMDVDESEIKIGNTSITQEPVNPPKSQNTERDAVEINCAISKRQLEIKITAIATREKRSDFKKICWYVNDDILKQYNYEGLPVPSAWESLSQPAKTPAKPKTEEAPATTPGRKTPVPSITQFARPMSPSAIAAQHAAAQAKILAAQVEKKRESEAAEQKKKESEAAEREKKEAEKMEVSEPSQETVTPKKDIKKAPDDQRKLTDFTNAIVSPNPNLKRRIVPTKIVDVNSQVKPINQVDAKGVKVEGAINIKPIEKIVIPPPSVGPINGMIDTTGENSCDAILID